MAVTTQMRTDVSKLYVALFQRAPDGEGLGYWVTQLSNGTSLTQVANDMYSVSAARAYYPAFATNAEIVTSFYTNTLGRAPDAAGAAYWEAQLNKAGATPGAVIGDMIYAVTNYVAPTTGTAQELADAALGTTSKNLFANKAAVAEYYGLKNGNIAGATTALNGVTADAASVATAEAVIDGTIAAAAGQTFDLTTGIDVITGTAGNDTINAVIDGTTNAVATTLNPLDSIDGSGGTDTLSLSIANGTGGTGTAVGALPAVTLSSVETLNIRSAVGLTADTSAAGWKSVSNVNVTQGAAVTLTADSAQKVSVAGASGAVAIDGGASQTVTTDGTTVTLGATTVTTGAVSVTHTAQAASAIAIDGGSTVNVTALGTTTGTVGVGQGGAATDLPTGAVTVSVTGKDYVAATGGTLGALSIKGGTTVSVTEHAYGATTAAAADTTGATRVESAIGIDGVNKTTSVTVIQDATVTAVAGIVAVTGVKEAQTVTFVAMSANDTATVNGLTFTAAKTLTPAEVAAAFSNLTAGTTQGTAPVANGTYSGTFSAALTNGAKLTSGAVSGDKVVFTEGTASTTAFNLGVGGSALPTAAATVTGVTAVKLTTGVAGVTSGAVTISDTGAADKIATVTLSGFGASTIASDALTTLSLANSDAGVGITNAVATTLGLTVDGLGVVATGTLAAGGTYTALNIHVASDSALDITAAGVKTITVDGSGALDTSAAGSFGVVETVTVTGDAGIALPAAADGTLKTLTATGTTGSVTATVDPTKATVALGSGDDAITTAVSNSITKGIDLGAGDDTLTLKTGTTGTTAVLNGGDGTDTLAGAAADLATLSSTATFGGFINSFEKIEVGSAANKTIALANLDNANYVITDGGNTGAVSEVQNTAVSGAPSGGVTFLGHLVAGGTPVTAAALVTAIVADKVAIIAAWNAANPGREILNLASGAGTSVDITYALSEGNVSAYGGAVSGGSTFAAATETTPGDLGGLKLTGYGANGTLELGAASAGQNTTVTLADATGTADVFNILTKVGTADLDHGNVVVAGVETVNITATDTSTKVAINTSTLRVDAADAKTITVAGNANLSLTLDSNSQAVTTVTDTGSGVLTFSTLKSAAAATTVTGGSGDDVLTANHNGDTLIGGAGADTLTIGSNAGLVTLTGGDGIDTFDFSGSATAPSNSNSYATITDALAGDIIKFATSVTTFKAAVLTLAGTAVFQDFANEAVKSSSVGQVDWFQNGNNTYIVENVSGSTSFVNGQDIIIKLTGLVDLSHASFSSSAHTVIITA